MNEIYFRIKLENGKVGTLAHNSNVKRVVDEIKDIIKKDASGLPEKERENFKRLQLELQKAKLEFCEVMEPHFEVPITEYEGEEND